MATVEGLGNEDNLTPLSFSKARNSFYSNEKGMDKFEEMPEAGYVLGQRVENLREWAEVLVDSDLFAANTVMDYWKVLMGEPPLPHEIKQFRTLWTNFRETHEYDVEAMLKEFIFTEAYSVP